MTVTGKSILNICFSMIGIGDAIQTSFNNHQCTKQAIKKLPCYRNTHNSLLGTTNKLICLFCMIITSE